MSKQVIEIETSQVADSFKSDCDLSMLGLDAVSNLSNYLNGVSGGSYPSNISVKVGAVNASGTITVASTGSANDQTCTIAGVTFTAKTSGATGNQFNISTTPATQAANMSAAINASASLAGIVTCYADGAVVRMSCYAPGRIGNGVVAANVNLANTTFASMAGGSDGTEYNVISQIG